MAEKAGELRECPFCGGTNIQLSNGETFRWRYVGCAECGAQIEFRSDNRFEPTDETWSDAAEAWNRRSLPVGMSEGEILARSFHESYERLAPQFGYETRAETKAFDPTSSNGKLMIAVCMEIQNEARNQTLLAKRNRGGAGEVMVPRDRYETFGYALAMAVLQSPTYARLDDKARAECDELIARGQAAPAAGEKEEG